jgi:hypothetical protein
MELKDITLNTMATVGVLRQVDLSTDLAKVFCQTKTRIEDPICGTKIRASLTLTLTT